MKIMLQSIHQMKGATSMLEDYQVSFHRARNAYLNGYVVEIYGDGQLLDILERRNDTRKHATISFYFYVICATVWHGKLSYKLP